MEYDLKVGKLYRYTGSSYFGTLLVLANIDHEFDTRYAYSQVLVLNNNGRIERCILLLALCEEVG